MYVCVGGVSCCLMKDQASDPPPFVHFRSRSSGRPSVSVIPFRPSGKIPFQFLGSPVGPG